VVDAGRIDGDLANALNMDLPAPDKRPRLAKRARLHIDPVAGNPVLMDQEAILILNCSGYEILRLCDGTHTLSEVIRVLESRYPETASILAQEVAEYIEAINQRGLIEWI
jgi:pyrroloquinoline quinone biosynthesis protein D